MGKVYTTASIEETQQLAKDFAKNLKGGDILGLYGDLGAGKTTFVQGIAEGLGIDKRIISPTFVIVKQYKIKNRNVILASAASPESNGDPGQARMTENFPSIFYHIDLYRIQDQNDIKGLGIEEIINDRNNIVAIEWAEKLGDLLPKKRIDIYFEYISENKRMIKIT